MPASLPATITADLPSLPELSGDDTVVLFPSLGHLDRDGQSWRIAVHGEVFAPGPAGVGKVSIGKRIMLKLLRRAMKVPEEALETDIFRDRIARFLARDRAGRQIVVRLGDAKHVLPKASRRNGHFSGAVQLASGIAPPAAATGCGDAMRMTIDIFSPAGDRLVASGHAFLLPARGVSVISDIDDTLKHSFVACKRTLLANTFLREFEPVAGMAGLFRGWADGGATFHYVSSSPWQLYRHLAEHLQAQGFPDGSYHLRAFRLRDHVIGRILRLRRSGKASVIRTILKMFPERKFLLVGDSGELDPEIYGAMARKFPNQVAGIYIRQVGTRGTGPIRYQKAFRGVPYEVVRLFHESAELAEDPTVTRLLQKAQ